MILAIDQGTTATTALVLDSRARVIGRGRAAIVQSYPRPGWVEHDPEGIWDSVCAATAAALGMAGVSQPAAIGITNQRETVVSWDSRSGRPTAPAIVWQCRRTAETCARLRVEGLEPLVRERSGLVLDPYFSASKMGWLLTHSEATRAAASAGALRFGTVDTWIVSRLTGGDHLTDASNASRTLLLDLATGRWSDRLADIFGVPLATLPTIVDSSDPVGTTISVGPFPAGIPIAGIAGDQQAALFGHVDPSGGTKATYGTGCFLLQATGTDRPSDVPGLLTTVAWRLHGQTTFALEGSVFVGGALIQWLRDELGLIASAAESESLAREVEDSNDAVIVPAFVGLGAPYWDPQARGTIVGLTRGTTRAHLCRAALESIAHQVMDVLELMPERPTRLRVDGGAAANRLLLEMQAALAEIPVVRPAELETTALGAAYLAGLGIGFWPDIDEIRAAREPDIEVASDPNLRVLDRGTWKRAVDRARAWAPVESEG